MLKEQVDEQEWYTLQEASKITGKTPASLRRLIQRKVIERVKKEHSKHGDYWLINKKDLSSQYFNAAFVERHYVQGVHSEHEKGVQMNTISFETYDQHRREWEQRCSQLEQGLIMYRYKFEELDKQIKLLPAPPEVITNELQQKGEALKQAQKILEDVMITQKKYETEIMQLQTKLEEEERLKQINEELKKPWWKKLLGVR